MSFGKVFLGAAIVFCVASWWNAYADKRACRAVLPDVQALKYGQDDFIDVYTPLRPTNGEIYVHTRPIPFPIESGRLVYILAEIVEKCGK